MIRVRIPSQREITTEECESMNITALHAHWGLAWFVSGETMLLLVSPGRAEDSAAKPCDIGSRLELFVDRYLIDRMNGVEMRLHEPRPMPLARSPVTGGYMTVIKDGDLFRAYYRGRDPSYTGKEYSGHPGEITCYAESRDGHEWSFPVLQLYEVNGSRGNNVILAKASPFCHNFSPLLDSRPGADPSERYKALAGHPGPNRKVKADGLHAFVSADGVHWKKRGEEPVIPYDPAWSHAFDSQNVSFWSEAEQCYVCYFRTYSSSHGRLRTIFRTTSADFTQWSKPVATNPNRPKEELYTSQTHPYFRAPHIYIALPTRFQPDRGSSTDILFMSSRAGSASFDRTFPEAFIRPGLDPERWGNRSNYAALNVVPTGPAEMSIYHAKSGYRYVLRTDGFVSIRAGATPGELRTRPLVFAGAELLLNVSTSAGGDLRVEIQDAGGTPIPGFEMDRCHRVTTDAIEHVVHWKGDPDLARLTGRPVRLRFAMTECDLYSLRFR